MEEAEEFHTACRRNNEHITHYADCKYFVSTDILTTTQLECFEITGVGYYQCGINVLDPDSKGDGLVLYWSATTGRSQDYVQEYTQRGHMYAIENEAPIEDLIDYVKG